MEKPKVWCVKNDGSQEFKDTVVKYLSEKFRNRYYQGNSKNYYYGEEKNGKQECWSDPSNFNNNILTIEQFKNIFMRKIIGYKIKPEFESKKYLIQRTFDLDEDVVNNNFKHNSWHFERETWCEDRAKELGVLELWFEPVYEDDKIEICGKQVEFGCDSIRVDGSRYDKDVLEVVKGVLMLPKVKGLLVGCKEEKLTLETIDKILNRLK